MAEMTYVKLTEDQSSLQNITPGELNQAIDIEKLNARTCETCGQHLPASYTPPADEDWATGICGCFEDSDSLSKNIALSRNMYSNNIGIAHPIFVGITGLFCPCVLFGRNIAAFNDEITPERACVGHAVCIEGGIAAAALTAAFNGVIDPDTVCLLTEGFLFAWWVCAIYTGMGRQSLQRKYHLKDAPCDPCLVHCCMHWCAMCQEHREMKHHLAEGMTSNSTVMDPPQLQQMKPKDHPSSSSSQDQDAQNNLQLQPI